MLGKRGSLGSKQNQCLAAGAMCKHTDLVKYGSAAVFQPLLSDLKSLEVDGIDLGPKFGIQRGTVLFAVGDNLGSHMLGGFQESF
jgi:hypothetical protein